MIPNLKGKSLRVNFPSGYYIICKIEGSQESTAVSHRDTVYIRVDDFHFKNGFPQKRIFYLKRQEFEKLLKGKLSDISFGPMPGVKLKLI